MMCDVFDPAGVSVTKEKNEQAGDPEHLAEFHSYAIFPVGFLREQLHRIRM